MGMRSLGLGVFGASLAIARLASAQTEPSEPPTPSPPASEPAPAPAPAAAPERPAPNASSMIVVADPFDDETENAKLRARIYEAGRSKGFSADTQTDVRDRAIDAGAMREGRVSTDEKALQSLRKSIGAGVLVRVARESRGMRVMVVREGGVSDDLVRSPDQVPDAVVRLLSARKGSASAAGAGASTGEGIEAGYIVPHKTGEDEKDLTDPKVLAKAWDDRGGVRPLYGARFDLIGLLIPDTPYESQNPVTNQKETGKADTFGVGAGLGVQVGMIYLPMPTPATGKAWQAFRLNVGFDAMGLYVHAPVGYSYQVSGGAVSTRDTDYANPAYIYGIIPIQLGVLFGIGDFRLSTLWRGVALGIAYSPAVILSLKVGENENGIDAHFNYAGFELSVDSVKIEAGEGNQPHLRFSAMVLPRVNDELPWIGMIGIGAFWY